MERFELLDTIDDIGDVENNFIVELARGVSSFVNSIDASLNNLKKSHLDILYDNQNSNLINDVRKEYSQSDLVKHRRTKVLIVPKTKRFFTTNIFYTGSLNLLVEELSFVTDSILEIKRFRTKPKMRISMESVPADVLRIDKLLKGINENKKEVFFTEVKDEYAEAGGYFGNADSIHKSLDRMYDINKKISDVELHTLKNDMLKLSKELKKLIELLDSTTLVMSKDALNAIITRVNTAANLITTVAILYTVHVDSIASLLDLKEKTE